MAAKNGSLIHRLVTKRRLRALLLTRTRSGHAILQHPRDLHLTRTLCWNAILLHTRCHPRCHTRRNTWRRGIARSDIQIYRFCNDEMPPSVCL